MNARATMPMNMMTSMKINNTAVESKNQSKIAREYSRKYNYSIERPDASI